MVLDGRPFSRVLVLLGWTPNHKGAGGEREVPGSRSAAITQQKPGTTKAFQNKHGDWRGRGSSMGKLQAALDLIRHHFLKLLENAIQSGVFE